MVAVVCVRGEEAGMMFDRNFWNCEKVLKRVALLPKKKDDDSKETFENHL